MLSVGQSISVDTWARFRSRHDRSKVWVSSIQFSNNFSIEFDWEDFTTHQQPSKIKGKIPFVFNLTNIVCRTGRLLGLILDKHLDRDINILNFSTHSKDGANEEASLRQRTMYDKSWGTDASVLSSRFRNFSPLKWGLSAMQGRIWEE